MIESSFSPPRRVSRTQMGHHPPVTAVGAVVDLAMRTTRNKLDGLLPGYRETEKIIYNTFMERQRTLAKGPMLPLNLQQQNTFINVQRLPEFDSTNLFNKAAKNDDGSKKSMRKMHSEHEDFHDLSVTKLDKGLNVSKKHSQSGSGDYFDGNQQMHHKKSFGKVIS